MHKGKKRTINASVAQRVQCVCLPLAMIDQDQASADRESDGYTEREEQLEFSVLIAQELFRKLQTILYLFLSRGEVVSMLLLHVHQLESPPLAPELCLQYRRRRFHAPSEVMTQIMAAVQRVIRTDDRLCVIQDSGAALIFPHVDAQGIATIAERVYQSVELLAAETLVPPLTRETSIMMGIGSFPDPAATPEQLYQQVSHVLHSLTLRPAITTQLHGVRPDPFYSLRAATLSAHQKEAVPFMELPQALPTRVTRWLGVDLARELQCVPVGHEQHVLTVALVDPTNRTTIARLQDYTGMTIFPVACEVEELRALLLQGW
jgi:hypothetical protein